MHVSLTELLETYVWEKVASDLHNIASEVIREALRLKTAEDRADAMRRQRLIEEIGLGWQRADRGEFADFSPERSLARLDGQG